MSRTDDYRFLRCLFVARPLGAIDASRDFHASTAMRFSDTTRAEDVVREALRHAAAKLEATLACPPQKLLVLLRHKGIITALPISDRLLAIPRFIDAASNPEDPSPVIILAAPNTAANSVDKLTTPATPRIGGDGGETSPVGFASFVGKPKLRELEQPIGGEMRPVSPLSVPGEPSALVRKGSSTGAPSELFVRHATEALRRNPSLSSFRESSQSPKNELAPLPLTVRVAYFSVFGERVEVEVPYMSNDSVQSIIATAAAAMSRSLIKPLDVEADEFALYYRRRDGTELAFTGDAPLPLPKSTSPPTLFLARCSLGERPRSPRSPRSMFQTDSSRAIVSPPAAAVSRDTPPRPAVATDDEKALRACREEADALRTLYDDYSREQRAATDARSELSALVAERDDVLRRRRASQDRWTECATVARDVDRLREQIAWFEREASQLRDRETTLTLKLHRLTTQSGV